jgi:hypothetical protein
MPILNGTKFPQYIKDRYQVGTESIIRDEEVDDFIGA